MMLQILRKKMRGEEQDRERKGERGGKIAGDEASDITDNENLSLVR